MFGLIQNTFERFFARIALILYLFRDPDEFPLHGIFFYNITIIFDIRGCRNRTHQFSNEFQTGDFLWYILFLEFILQCNQIHRLSAAVQFDHRIKENSILLVIKIFLQKDLHGCDNGILIHDHGTNDRLLGFQTVRHHPLDQRFFQANFLLFLNNLNTQCCGYLWMKLHRNLISSKSLDGFAQLHLLFIQIQPCLLFCSLCNFLGGNRPENTSALTGFDLYNNFLCSDLFRQFLCVL